MSDKAYFTKDGMVTLAGFIRGYQQEVTLSNLPTSVIVASHATVSWPKRAQLCLTLCCENYDTQLYSTALRVYTANADDQRYSAFLSAITPKQFHEGLPSARKAWRDIYAAHFTPVLKTIPSASMYDRVRRTRVRGYRISNRQVIVRKAGVGMEASDTLMGFGLSWAKQHPSAEGNSLYAGFHIYTTY